MPIVSKATIVVSARDDVEIRASLTHPEGRGWRVEIRVVGQPPIKRSLGRHQPEAMDKWALVKATMLMGQVSRHEASTILRQVETLVGTPAPELKPESQPIHRATQVGITPIVQPIIAPVAYPTPAKLPTMAAFIKWYFKTRQGDRNFNDKTRILTSIALRRLLSFVGDVPLPEITPRSLEAWKNALSDSDSPRSPGKKLSSATVNTYLRNIRAAFGYAGRVEELATFGVDELWLKRLNRARYIKVQETGPKAFSPEEIHAVWKAFALAAESDPTMQIAWEMATVSILTAGRLGSIVRLMVKDVALSDEGAVVTFRNAKGGKTYSVPGGRDLRAILIKVLNGRQTPEAYLWPSPKHPDRSWEAGNISKKVGRLCKRAGVEKGHFHSLRHTAITRALEANGGDLRAVQELAAHSNISTTAGYLSTFRENVIRAGRGLDNMLPK